MLFALCLALATPAAAVTEVDALLALGIDVSGSTARSEFELMVNGIADAFDTAAVQNAIAAGPNGRIAVTLYMWNGEGQDQDLLWTEVDASSAGAFASQVRGLLDPIPSITVDLGGGPITLTPTDFGQMLPHWLEPFFVNVSGSSVSLGGGTGDGFGFTAIADAMDFGAGLFGQPHDFTSSRRLIDIAGDGFENVDFDVAGCTPSGAINCANPGFVVDPLFPSQITDPDTYFRFVTAARDAVAAAGIGINGLPILTDVSDLDQFYASYVVSGAGAFVLPASGFDAFAAGFEQKLTQEIVPEPGLPGLLSLAALAAGALARRAA
jgi:hypothetical protein